MALERTVHKQQAGAFGVDLKPGGLVQRAETLQAPREVWRDRDAAADVDAFDFPGACVAPKHGPPFGLLHAKQTAVAQDHANLVHAGADLGQMRLDQISACPEQRLLVDAHKLGAGEVEKLGGVLMAPGREPMDTWAQDRMKDAVAQHDGALVFLHRDSQSPKERGEHGVGHPSSPECRAPVVCWIGASKVREPGADRNASTAGRGERASRTVGGPAPFEARLTVGRLGLHPRR